MMLPKSHECFLEEMSIAQALALQAAGRISEARNAFPDPVMLEWAQLLVQITDFDLFESPRVAVVDPKHLLVRALDNEGQVLAIVIEAMDFETYYWSSTGHPPSRDLKTIADWVENNSYYELSLHREYRNDPERLKVAFELILAAKEKYGCD